MGSRKAEVESRDLTGKNSSPRDLKERTQTFALGAIRLVRALPNSAEAWVIGKQLLRSATSVGANYRACQRGKSRADFIAKLAIAEEEADECCYWLELVVAAELLPRKRVEPLLQEAGETVFRIGEIEPCDGGRAFAAVI